MDKIHGRIAVYYVRSVTHAANDFVDAGLITETEKGQIVSEAAESDCGHKK